jgi:hypothetical protein
VLVAVCPVVAVVWVFVAVPGAQELDHRTDNSGLGPPMSSQDRAIPMRKKMTTQDAQVADQGGAAGMAGQADPDGQLYRERCHHDHQEQCVAQVQVALAPGRRLGWWRL